MGDSINRIKKIQDFLKDLENYCEDTEMKDEEISDIISFLWDIEGELELWNEEHDDLKNDFHDLMVENKELKSKNNYCNKCDKLIKLRE